MRGSAWAKGGICHGQLLMDEALRFRLIAEHASEITFWLDPQGAFEWGSASVTGVLGWPLSQMIGRPAADFVHADDRATLLAAITSDDDGTRSVSRCRYLHLDGGYRWMEVTARTIRDHEGVALGRVGSARQIDSQIATEQSLARSEETYRLLAENVSDVVIRARHWQVLWVSPSISRVLGWLPSEWVGHDVRTFLHDDEGPGLREAAMRELAGAVVHARRRVRSSLGFYHWVESSSSLYFGPDGTADGVLVSVRLADQAVAAEEELSRQARVDELTGCFKRATAIEHLESTVDADPVSGIACGALFIDVDDLRGLNGRAGHASGDAVLRSVARRIREGVRGSDIVARVGGDEFVVIVDEVRSLDEAASLAEQLRRAVADTPVLEGHDVAVTVSVGATLHRLGERPEVSLARADEALFEAKRAGGNAVRLIEPP